MFLNNFKKPENEKKKYLGTYGGKVFLLKQSKYKLYSLLFIVGMVLVNIFMIGVIAYLFDNLYIFFIPTIILLIGTMYSGIIGDFINYYFYFLIITPKEIIEYKQGFYSSNIKTIQIGELETISVFKEGFLANIFNFGCIQFTFNNTETSIDYIYNINSTEEEIRLLLK